MRVIVLGASGYVGKQVIEVLETKFSTYQLIGISYYHNLTFAKYIKSKYPNVKLASPSDDNFADFKGENAIKQLLNSLKYDIVVNALSGLAGLTPTLEVLKAQKTLILANKEAIITGYDKIKELLKNGGKIIPVDSEHSALKHLINLATKPIKYYAITASGGSMLNKTKKEMETASIDDVLKHPSWNMGKGITIDSASMVNKLYEILEAHYLFDLPLEKIKVFLDQKSLVHAQIIYQDYTGLALSYPPDMKTPIAYALSLEKDDSMYSINAIDYRDLVSKNMTFDDLEFKHPLLNLKTHLVDNYHKTKQFIIYNEKLKSEFINGEINFYQFYKKLLEFK
jgi:1-deoxy-D-xylulose-5-phosphate reductoisomerase